MAKAQIMVVEDESIVAEDIRTSLQNMGYEVPAVMSSGEEAVKKAEELRPDLVLMDIVLRDKMNGIDAAAHIRSTLNIPVVYLTAYADEKTLARAKMTEPFGYIIKPFEDRELHSTIEIAIYKHRTEQKLKNSQEWFSTLLRSIGDAVIATDIEGLVMFMNPVAEVLTGWKEQEAAGKGFDKIFRIIDEETERKMDDPVKKVLEENSVIGLERHTVLVSKDGTRRPIDDSAAPIRSDKGDVIGVVLVFQDTSERIKMEGDIKNRMTDLENFYNMSVGRELKMKKLKEEIEKLKSELAQYKK